MMGGGTRLCEMMRGVLGLLTRPSSHPSYPEPLPLLPHILCRYLSGTAFNDAIDALLSRLPGLEALHAGNNTMCTEQGTCPFPGALLSVLE